jgi:hypothetical protein
MQHRFKIVRKYGPKTAAAVGSLASAGLALADGGTIDTSAATAGITSAQTAVLAVIAAMTVMAIAVWGVKKVMRLFGR